MCNVQSYLMDISLVDIYEMEYQPLQLLRFSQRHDDEPRN
jgi:hypothetical protein